MMTKSRRVPSLSWLVGGGVLGTLIGGVVFVGLTQYARSKATTVVDLRRANDTIKYDAFGLTDGAKPQRLERGWSLIGSVDRRCIWVLRGRTWREYEGVAGTYGREVPAGPGNWLVADTPLGPLVFDSDRGVRLLDRDDLSHDLKRWASSEPPLLAHDTMLVWRDGHCRLLVEDLESRASVTVDLPLWRLHQTPTGPASLSPDRRWLAVTGDAIVGQLPSGLPPEERARRKRQGSALVLVDLLEGSTVLVEGYFESFAHRPVWSADGSWIFVGVPFERAMYAVFVDGHGPHRLQRVDAIEGASPMPMIDLRTAQAARPDHDSTSD